jgi:hypothetical protein
MKYFVYTKDVFGKIWTVVVDGTEQMRLADAFEFAKYKTFGGDAIGVKEVFSPSEGFKIQYKHGDVYAGLV